MGASQPLGDLAYSLLLCQGRTGAALPALGCLQAGLALIILAGDQGKQLCAPLPNPHAHQPLGTTSQSGYPTATAQTLMASGKDGPSASVQK